MGIRRRNSHIDLEDLTRLTNLELVDLFRALDCPTLDEMDGEYSARLLAAPNRALAALGHVAVNNPFVGHWVGKTFTPPNSPDSPSGRGHNYFRRFGVIVRSQPMATTITASRLDGRPAFQLAYRAFVSPCALVNMVDEVRRVSPGLYLGIGTVGFTADQRSIPLPFQLSGPDAPYSGDIGIRNPLVPVY